jgi:hypothetical protein
LSSLSRTVWKALSISSPIAPMRRDHANVHLEPFYNILDGVLQWMDAVLNDNTELRVTYDASRAETAALQVAVDTLTRTLNKQIATPAPPSPDLTASSTMMVE